jgi:acetylornithine deacetylase/succinyl-diaminopimelate desuccinylase-like protein
MEVDGPNHDLHSGQYGGAIHNPLHALCEIIAQLHDKHGRIVIPGFYDRVRDWGHAARDYFRAIAPSDAQIKKNANVDAGHGETGYTLYERTTLRPSLDVNGISGGYEGIGNKAIVPSSASAKLGFRLVPNQRAAEIETLVRDHLARITPPTVHLRIRTISRADPATFDPAGRPLRAATRAYESGFGRAPILMRSGGTIPVANYFSKELGLPVVLMGFGLPTDRAHAPNERFGLSNFYRGIVTSVCFLSNLAKESSRQSTINDSALEEVFM